MNQRFSKAANAYVKVTRRHSPPDSTWFDVARAYDEGMRHALENRQSAKRNLNEASSDSSGSVLAESSAGATLPNRPAVNGTASMGSRHQEIVRRADMLYEAVHGGLEEMTDAELRSLERSASRLTDTNCWWAQYRLARLILPAIDDERRRRLQESLSDSETNVLEP